MPTRSENPVKNWLLDEFAWIGFILTAMVGGVVGFIKSYEQAAVETTLRAKVWAIVRRVFMAGFAGFLIWQLSIEYNLSSAWGHVTSGIVGMFAAEFFEVLWVSVKTRIELMMGRGK